jgi:hypothetical protein
LWLVKVAVQQKEMASPLAVLLSWVSWTWVYLLAEGFFLHAFLSDQLAHALRWIEFLDHPVFAQAALQSSFFLLCLSNASCHLCIPFD